LLIRPICQVSLPFQINVWQQFCGLDASTRA